MKGLLENKIDTGIKVIVSYVGFTNISTESITIVVGGILLWKIIECVHTYMMRNNPKEVDNDKTTFR